MRTAIILCSLLLCLPAVRPASAQPPPDEQVRQALEKMQTGDNRGAVALLEQARRDGKASPQALALLGAIYVRAGRAADAAGVLEPLAERAEADPAVLYNLAQAYLALGDETRAEQLLERSLAREPVSPAARLLGMRRGQQKRYAEAYRLLKPWTLANPNDREARLAAIYAALKINRTAEAEELIVDLPPDNPDVALLRARLQLQLGDPHAAIETIKALGRNNPGEMDYDTRVLLAEALVSTGQPSLALEIMDGQPIENAGVALMLSQARFQLGDVQGAIRTLSPVAEPLLAGPLPEDPRRRGLEATLLLEYGNYRLAAGDPQRAIQALERATQLHPDGARGWLMLADALRAAGRTAEADEAQR
ncbi:MAG: tetratricopeptide repeat protein, partial [Acidobacteria bacterium]